MLAKITEGIPDALKQLKGQAFLAEYKYDGQRAQIHLLPDRSVRLFSRNCEDKTAAFPDVVEAVQRNATGEMFVQDAEVISGHLTWPPSPPPPPPLPSQHPFPWSLTPFGHREDKTADFPDVVEAVQRDATGETTTQDQFITTLWDQVIFSMMQ